MNNSKNTSPGFFNRYKVPILIAAGLLIVLAAFLAVRSTVISKKRSQESVMVMQSVMDTLQVESYFRDDFKRRALHHNFIQFYRDRDFRLAWSTLRKPLPIADSLFKAIKQASAEGLQSDDYNLQELQEMRDTVFKRTLLKTQYKRPDLLKLVQLDFQLTAAYLTYASHLKVGRIEPSRLDTNWLSASKSASLAPNLEKAVRSKRVHHALLELLPRQGNYEQLKEQLALHHRIVQQGGWPSIAASQFYQKGRKNLAVSALRRRLLLSGDLDGSATPGDSTTFDEKVLAAIQRFQERHGLKPTGKVDAETIEAMNVPAEKRLEQIALNMERVRWLPDKLGKRYVVVNVPEFRLRVMEKDKPALAMRVIVGKYYHFTPVFSDTMEYVVFSPEWTVPRSIAVKEVLPALQRNSAFLVSNNYEVYPSWNTRDTIPLDSESIDWQSLSADTMQQYRVVQKAGPSNSLGLVKFMFPNKMDIYLHDTPADYLFDRNERTFSHGCVRVEKPAELAEYLLKSKAKWDKTAIEEAMHAEEPKTVPLPQKVPVYILYQTAYVDEQGRLNFRNDVYGHDQKQLFAIKRKSAQL